MMQDEDNKMAPAGPNPDADGRLDGRVSAWTTERGFGWVEYEGGSLFAHIKEFDKGFVPRKGDEVTFEKGLDPKGRPCATAVVARRKDVGSPVRAFLKLLPLLVLPFWANLKLPIAMWMVPAAMLPMSVAAWVMYRDDKNRAATGRWRVTETELHGLELFGGWPGAFLAQRKYRHKTRKLSYQAMFWAIVFLYQLAALDMVLDHLLWKEAGAFVKEWLMPGDR